MYTHHYSGSHTARPIPLRTLADTLNRGRMWARVSRLRWRPLSRGGAYTEAELLAAARDIEGLREALIGLCASVSDAYPALATLPLRERAQIIALGPDTTQAAATDAGYRQELKKEMQPIDLCKVLQLTCQPS